MEKWYQQTPNLDLNTLDENYELLFDYDSKGNLRRIRKVRRHQGGAILVAVLLIVMLLIAAWYVIAGG